jgi:integrase
MAGKTWRSEDRRLNSGGRALSSGLQTPEGVLGVLASESTRRLLFATRNGTPWDQNLLLKRKFKPLLRALGIQVPRGNGFHAFRHANATLMNSFGASQKLRQQRLGHADGSPVTDTIYTHVISEDGKRIAAQLGKAVWGVLDPSWTLKENGSGVESPKPLYLN